VVCAEWGNQATVPFLPRGDRPVYRSDCFSRQGGGGGGGGRYSANKQGRPPSPAYTMRMKCALSIQR